VNASGTIGLGCPLELKENFLIIVDGVPVLIHVVVHDLDGGAFMDNLIL
jgi:hypothetical protein